MSKYIINDDDAEYILDLLKEIEEADETNGKISYAMHLIENVIKVGEEKEDKLTKKVKDYLLWLES
ncbi:MAG: hypothetical protein GY861_16010 [bacterium]|nr:hypothetical protein [bacterium]